jgi:hypothetical protein
MGDSSDRSAVIESQSARAQSGMMKRARARARVHGNEDE